MHEFSEQLSDFNIPIPQCIISNNDKQYCFLVSKSIIKRIFQEGITFNMRAFISENIKKGKFSGIKNEG